MTDNYFLPEGYSINPQGSREVAANAVFWERKDLRETFQVPVYRLAASLAKQHGFKSVADFGCGHGVKLRKYVASGDLSAIGIDQKSGIDLARSAHPEGTWIEADLATDEAWHDLEASGLNFDLALCVDVIEHVDDPAALLRSFRRLLSKVGANLLISTPDRSLIEAPRMMGPPHNIRHVREWTSTEFTQLLKREGFDVQGQWNFRPRTYQMPRDAVRTIYRLLQGRDPFDTKHSMAFLVTPR